MFCVRVHGRGGEAVAAFCRIVRRHSAFDEVVGGLDESDACDNRYGVCPDDAVVRLDQPGPYRYEIDLDFCKGCGLCAAECPCGAIEMEQETT
jgi:Pyruvate/2-oxoacid:ferredoxin oxidoreductase delta subunit